MILILMIESILHSKKIPYQDANILKCLKKNIDYVLETFIKNFNKKKQNKSIKEKEVLIQTCLQDIPDYIVYESTGIDYCYLSQRF